MKTCREKHALCDHCGKFLNFVYLFHRTIAQAALALRSTGVKQDSPVKDTAVYPLLENEVKLTGYTSYLNMLFITFIWLHIKPFGLALKNFKPCSTQQVALCSSGRISNLCAKSSDFLSRVRKIRHTYCTPTHTSASTKLVNSIKNFTCTRFI